MAKAEIKIDTTEAMEKIKALNNESKKFKAAMVGVKQAAEETTKAMCEFVYACSRIGGGMK